MSILVNKDSKVIVQGFTGKEGSFHAQQMIDYGTQVVGGVTPNKGGQIHHMNLPVFNTVYGAVQETGADRIDYISYLLLLQLMQLWKRLMQVLSLIVTITEGIPVKDMIYAKAYIDDQRSKNDWPKLPRSNYAW